MQRQLLRVENVLLSLFPLIYGLFIVPAATTYEVFYTPRISLLLGFSILMLIVRLAVSSEVNFAMLGQSVKRLDLYMMALALFLVSLAITTMLTFDQDQALFGTINFHTGALFILLVALTFWLYSSGRAVSRVGLALLVIVFSLLTVLEYLGFRPLTFITDTHEKLDTLFPAVTVGYRGQVSGVSILLSLLPLYWFRGRYRDWRFWALFIVGSVGLGCTTNSSATIGFALSILIFVLVSKKTMLTALLIPLVALGSLNAYRPLTTLSDQLNTLGRVHNRAIAKDIGSTVTLKTRLILWEAGLRMFAAKPVFGWGPQTYSHYWFRYVSKTKGDLLYRLELSLKPEQKLARVGDAAVYKDLNGKNVPVALNYTTPHSAVVDLLYSQGIAGFSFFCFFLLLLLWYVSKRMGRVAWLALLPLIGYFIYLSAWFITVPATGLAAIILGMAVSDARNSRPATLATKEVTSS